MAAAVATLATAHYWYGTIPTFSHDWKYPLDITAARTWPHTLTSLWLDWGSGGPAVTTLGRYPVILSTWFISSFAGTFAAFAIIMSMILIAAGVGAGKAAAALGYESGSQVAIAAIYPILPPVFNRFCAGHIEWMLAYGIVPFIVCVAAKESTPAVRTAKMAILIALAGSQAQFFIIVALFALLVTKPSLRFQTAVGIFLAFVLQIPMWAALLLGHPSVAFASERANLSWQFAQSSPITISLLAGADPIHYFEREAHLYAAWPITLLLALMGLLSRRIPRWIGVMWLLAATWSAGLLGPFGSLDRYLFRHFEQATVFREFSHFQMIVALPMLLLAIEGALYVSANATVRAGLAVAALLPLVVPSVDGSALKFLHLAWPTDVPAGLYAYLEKLPTAGKILWWPGVAPLRYDGSRAGVDSDAFRFGTHEPFSEYRPTTALVTALYAVQSGDAAGCALLANLDISTVVIRSRVQSARTRLGLQSNPASASLKQAGLRYQWSVDGARIYTLPCYRGTLTIGPEKHLYGDWSVFAKKSHLHPFDALTAPPRTNDFAQAFQPDSRYDGLDSGKDWVPVSADDELLEKFPNAFEDTVAVKNPRLPVESQRILAASPHKRYRWMSLREATVLRRRFPISIWQTAKPWRNQRPESSEQKAASDQRQPHSLAVLHRASFGTWVAQTEKGQQLPALLADGYAVGWLVPAKTRQISVSYAGPPIILLWELVIAGWTCALIMLMIRRKVVPFLKQHPHLTGREGE
ncbi:MAG: hypothetical protein M3Z14_04715 [Candidatus Eremiobacteraeota bacterium]|nr:hypothetical protein [Candidatus Eremiobacteraeota bacterium]